MRVSSIILLSSIFVSDSNARLTRISYSRHLTPEDVGAYHTDAFAILGDKYQVEKPETQLDVIQDIGDILADYCPTGDTECTSNAYETTVQKFQLDATGITREIQYPADFDLKMKKSVDGIESTIQNINELNLDDIISSLEEIRNELEDMSDGNEAHLLVSLAGISVAIESTKLWHATYYDSDHPLHEMIGYFSLQGKNRKLQGIPPLLLTLDPEIILSDYRVAMMTGMAALQAAVGNPAELFNVLGPAVMASANAFFGGAMVPFDDDGSDDDGNDDATDDGNSILCTVASFLCR